MTKISVQEDIRKPPRLGKIPESILGIVITIVDVTVQPRHVIKGFMKSWVALTPGMQTDCGSNTAEGLRGVVGGRGVAGRGGLADFLSKAGERLMELREIGVGYVVPIGQGGKNLVGYFGS